MILDNLSASPLYQSWNLLSQGIHNQGIRVTLATQNYVNKDSTGSTPGSDPYRRQVPLFEVRIDMKTKARVPLLKSVVLDETPFNAIYKPGHPAADADGFVKTPNVNGYLEASDVQESFVGLNACSRLYELVTAMVGRTHDLMMSRNA